MVSDGKGWRAGGTAVTLAQLDQRLIKGKCYCPDLHHLDGVSEIFCFKKWMMIAEAAFLPEKLLFYADDEYEDDDLC